MRSRFVNPGGIVEGAKDEALHVDEASGVLPAPGLVAPDEAAQDAGLADRVVGPADRSQVETRHGHVLLDEPDVVIVLDQVFRDPGRHPVALGQVSQRPSRCGDRMPADPVIGVGAQDLRFVPPFGGRELREVGVREPELSHVLGVLNGRLEPEHPERFEVARAADERIEVILLPLVDGRGQPVGLLPGESAEQAFFGGHVRIIERPPGRVNAACQPARPMT